MHRCESLDQLVLCTCNSSGLVQIEASVIVMAAMADPSLVSMDYRLVNDTTIRPNLLLDPTTSAYITESSEFPSTTTRLLLESLYSTLSARNSYENGTNATSTTWDSCDTENPFFNCSVLEFLEYYQGPQMMPFLKAIMVSSSNAI